MHNRKRVNISVSPQTYKKLQRLKQAHGFKSVCQLVAAITCIFVDRMGRKDEREYDLPDDDGRYIDEMFDDLGHVQRTPDGEVPVRRHTRRLE